MRRGFREVHNPERNIESMERKEKNINEGFKQIKPETDITSEQAQNFWDFWDKFFAENF